ncbi:hypothetical protein Pla111_24070 [Botrimarina hoheduenensis]|uniref:Uncharacterized protein n=2 Tax=Botrimarina hoheduenensis TaxID=2528000 RepID=A0A5C5VXW0_9BACT|nr:hypothetical protein Pla111_24070 [Botrimarina hoheduenensis]
MSMSDKQLEELLAKARKRYGYCPLTPQEAEKAFENATEAPLPDGFIQSVLGKLSGEQETAPDTPISYEWMEESDYKDVEEALLQLNRNKGDEDEDADETENTLRNEMLSDDDDEDGMAGETESP